MQVLLVSHNGFASGLKKAAEFIIGEQDQIFVAEMKEAGIEQFENDVRNVIQAFDVKEKILLLSDIPAGSPGTTALNILTDLGYETNFVSGINLAFLLELCLSKDVNRAIESGKSSLAEIVADCNDEEDEEF